MVPSAPATPTRPSAPVPPSNLSEVTALSPILSVVTPPSAIWIPASANNLAVPSVVPVNSNPPATAKSPFVVAIVFANSSKASLTFVDVKPESVLS
ncbi:hypothetical protein Myrod_0625 [Myroides odoratus DSM 2801]|nr:hypothetical protein Myrod_0625 [Myroides odoratus DSM 2801]